ncbi:SAF domain-containing protein [Corynebacterium faecale]
MGMDVKTTLTTPGWHRTLLIRRSLAAFLLLIAAILFIRSLISTDPQVAVFVSDIPAGAAITASDVNLQNIPSALVPHTAVLDTSDAVGRIAASAITAGEIVTSPRFVGNELIASFVGNGTEDFSGEQLHMVPLKLADPSVIPLLHHGDTISVISHDPGSGLPHTIAAGGKVVLVGESGTSDPSTVLIALPESSSGLVAAASLSAPLAVVLTGDRSG